MSPARTWESPSTSDGTTCGSSIPTGNTPSCPALRLSRSIRSSPSDAQTSANTELTALSGKGIKASVLPDAFKEIVFTNDPDAASLATDAQQAKAVGLLTSTDLNGIFDLGPVNKLLQAAGESQVKS